MAQLGFGFKTPPRPRKPRRGRPPKRGAGVPHAPRRVDSRHPLHITIRVRDHVWNLRARRCFRVLERAFFIAAARAGSRLAHFSVQHNHVHLLMEAPDAKTLGKTLQGLGIRVAKGLNRVMQRKGAVFADRYHARSLRTPTEVRAALVYVMNNRRKHAFPGERFDRDFADPCSSAAYLDGWVRPPPRPCGPAPVCRPGTWLLAVGWRERGGGPLRLDEGPTVRGSSRSP